LPVRPTTATAATIANVTSSHDNFWAQQNRGLEYLRIWIFFARNTDADRREFSTAFPLDSIRKSRVISANSKAWATTEKQVFHAFSFTVPKSKTAEVFSKISLHRLQ
jgi:hypothetical protein